MRCPACRLGVTLVDPAASEPDDDLLLQLADGEAVERPPAVSRVPASGEAESPQRSSYAEQAAILGDVGEKRTCPCCKQQLPSRAKICVDCGIDLKSGRAIAMRDDDHLSRVYVTTENIVSVISWLFFVGIYPVTSEAFGLRKPWVTRAVALVTISVSVWYLVAFIYNSDPEPSLLAWMHWTGQAVADAEIDPALQAFCEPRWYQPFTSALLHGDPLHLLGNLLFLFVLGSRVNMLIGNSLMLLAYPALAYFSGLIDSSVNFNGPLTPSLGASGAIMGLAGMYFVLLPATNVHVVAWWRWGLVAGFQLNMNIFPVRGFWLVAAYIALDILATVLRWEDGVAHWAHLGGFIAGVALGLTLLLARLVNARGGDLISVVLGKAAWAIVGKPNAKRLTLW